MQSLVLQDAESFGLNIKTPGFKIGCMLKYFSGSRPNDINCLCCQNFSQKLVQLCQEVLHS